MFLIAGLYNATWYNYSGIAYQEADGAATGRGDVTAFLFQSNISCRAFI